MYKQRGAVEACWAHNSEVGGSKPFAANFFLIIKMISNNHDIIYEIVIVYIFMYKSSKSFMCIITETHYLISKSH